MGFLSLVIQMSLNAAGVESGLKRAESSVSKFSRNISSNLKGQIGAALSVTAVMAAAKAAVDYGSKINDVSNRLGIGAERVQEFSYALKQAGGELDDATGAMQKLAATRMEALSDPTGKTAAAFAKLGVSVDDLKTARLDDLLLKIGDAFEKARNPQELLAAGFATMGKGSMPVIGAMREGLRGLGEDARNSWQIVSTEAVAALDELGDKWDQVKTGFLVGIGEITKELVSSFRLQSSFLRSTAKGVVSYWGGRLAGMSDKEASQFGRDERLAVVAADVARDQARLEAIQKRKALGEMALKFSPLTEATATATSSKSSGGIARPQLNNLQQIGAFSGVDPIVSELKSSHTTQKRIEANTKRMSMKRDTQSSDQF